MRGCAKGYSAIGYVCKQHGSAWTYSGCLAEVVAEKVLSHREEQYAKHGANRTVEDGTGPDVEWLTPVINRAMEGGFCDQINATETESLFREEWDFLNDATEEDKAEFMRQATWMRMVREEVAEAFKESDPELLEAELIQVAALCISWIEKLHERKMWQYGARYTDGRIFTLPYWTSPDIVYREQHGIVDKGSVVGMVRRRFGTEDWEEMP